MQNQYLIIVAGGTGSRMNSPLPKQFMDLGGEPVIMKTIRCFLTYNASMNIIISVHAQYLNYLQELIDKNDLKDAGIRLTAGGDTRFASVKNGLALVDNEQAVVGIHDAARPFVSQATIKNCFEAAAIHGSAIPCISIAESLRRIEGKTSAAVDRSAYRIVQTPQCFAVAKIKKAFEQGYSAAFTDDATVLEASGEAVHLVDGNVENIKITTPYDLVRTNSIT